MKYILVKLTNGEFAKLSVNDVVYICIANENDSGELFMERVIEIPELNSTIEK